MNLKKNRVTAVITAYNSERYIGRCIDSIINQEEEECEIIVINDGSSDDTKKVIETYGSRIRYYEFKTNQGPAVGRTRGLFETKTEYITFIDADDYWHPSFCKKTKEFLNINKSVIAAYTGYIKKDYNGKEYYRPVLDAKDKTYYYLGNICPNFYEFWYKYRAILTGTVLMRTEMAIKTKGQRSDLRLTQDLEFWGYLATFGKWAYIPLHLFVTDEQVLKPSERLRKFKKRFTFFKTLDLKSWTKRILPNLTDEKSLKYFYKFTNHIVTTIGFSKAYALDFKDGYDYSKKNYNNLEVSGWGKALRIGAKNGFIVWIFVCFALRSREYLKAYIYYYKSTFK